MLDDDAAKADLCVYWWEQINIDSEASVKRLFPLDVSVTPTSKEHLLMSHKYMTASAANGQTAV